MVRSIKPQFLQFILKEETKIQTTVSKTTVILSNEIKSAWQALMSGLESRINVIYLVRQGDNELVLNLLYIVLAHSF